MSVDLPLLLSLLLAGAFAGLLAGLLGVGGGIIVVPMLFTVLNLNGVDPAITMQIAVATSLATIVPASISSVWGHHERGAVDVALGKRWAIPIVVGALVGAAIGGSIEGAWLSLAFAVIAALIALWLLFGREDLRLADALPATVIGYGIPFTIGGVSALIGIGGGALSVSILTLYGYPIHRAVGTSSLFGFLLALPGAIGFVVAGLGEPRLPPGSLGFVNLWALAVLAPATILTAPLGARLAHRLSRTVLRRGFGVFLLLTAGRLLWHLYG